jgi:hypothetical protein
VRPPLTRGDGAQIADTIRPMMRSGEFVRWVEVVACTQSSCSGGIERRAEAAVSWPGGCLIDLIELCRKGDRWIASRPTMAEWTRPECPDQ